MLKDLIDFINFSWNFVVIASFLRFVLIYEITMNVDITAEDILDFYARLGEENSGGESESNDSEGSADSTQEVGSLHS